MQEESKNLTREEVLEAVKEMIKAYENLPPYAMVLPPTQYDLQSILLLLEAVLRAA